MTLALVTIHAEIECGICSGPRRGRQLTYALLDHRAPRATRFTPDEALAELTTRYFRSHGPATIRDYAWWSGLTTTEAKRGLEAAGAKRAAIDGLDDWTVGSAAAARMRRGRVDLLPICDEYMVAYRDLDAVPRGSGQFGRSSRRSSSTARSPARGRRSDRRRPRCWSARRVAS